MGVQLSEALKAARELGPEARAQLSNAVKREDLLIMLQDKADNSITSLLSEKTANSARSIEELSNNVLATLQQHAQTLVTLSIEREHGDATLGSRLDKMQSMMASVRAPLRQEPKAPAIKLPTSSLPTLVATPLQTAPLFPLDSNIVESTANEAVQTTPQLEASLKIESPVEFSLGKTRLAPPIFEHVSGQKLTSQAESNLGHPSVISQAINTSSKTKLHIPEEKHIEMVDATMSAMADLPPALTYYLKPDHPRPKQLINPGVCNQENKSLVNNESNILDAEVNEKLQSRDFVSLRCLSCDAPSRNCQSPIPPPSSRVLGGGFKIDNILSGVRGCVFSPLITCLYINVSRRVETEKLELRALQMQQ